ncbi:MAG: isoleucine--tRNA ligase [Verrucomicrobiae bacterium]|nr:isoleucine--tRNA ligase [Verrucomicrobiae bacterium]
MAIKDTLLLPTTAFPMKADLPKREPQILARWQKENIYSRIQEARRGAPLFILHDGPPFANGDAHLGHALNRTLKDIVLKSKTMAGFSTPFIPGWDCHGLPIEHKMIKEAGEQSSDPLIIRQKSEAYARRYISIQRSQFERLGAFADWQNPYLTIDPRYEAQILRTLADLLEKNLIYQGYRPVHWSTGCQTALAEAEIEYTPKEDLSIYVRFPLTSDSAKKLQLPEDTSLLIWTTTPWTLPANLAVAVAPHLAYQAFSTGQGAIIALATLAPRIPHLSTARPISAPILGQDLEGLTYHHPLLPRAGKIYTAAFVTDDTGTGLVHIAPGHGMDDYHLGQQHGLPLLSPVDENGRLTAEAQIPEVIGRYVFDANPTIRDLLSQRGLLWAEETYLHDYPHCWRSKTPVIFRAVKQWFIRVDAIKPTALDCIDRVQWIPSWGRNRIRAAVESRADWCISRQRTWGVPLPVFYDAQDQPVWSPESVRRLADLVEKHGTNIWFEWSSDQLSDALGLPQGLKKSLDTIDVWIDSGCSWRAVLHPQLFPADLYLEGSDQHRGWFQSSLLLSVAITGQAPFRKVLTSGFVVDLDGKKLSKSSTYQKPVDLLSLVNQYGADILRLWVASEEYRENVPYSEEIFKHVSDTYRTFRNTIRILLANLNGFNPEAHSVPYNEWPELERYLFMELQTVIQTCREAYETFAFHRVYHTLNQFCVTRLSSLYIDVRKDRMYCDGETNRARRAAQTLMYRCLDALLKLLAPIIPFTTEEAWSHLGHPDSIHISLFPAVEQIPESTTIRRRWEKLLALRDRALVALEAARQAKQIGKSLETRLEIVTNDFSDADAELLAEICIVSQVDLHSGSEETISVHPARGTKCERCWKYDESVGTHTDYPTLCTRCATVVRALRSA